MAEKQGELFPEDKKPKSTKRKRRKSNDLSIEDRAKIRTQRKQQADVVTEQEKFRESEREYWKKKNQEDFGNLKIMSPEMKETYTNNPGYPKFNEGTKKVMEGTKRGSKERLQGLKENIGNYGRLAIKNANPTGMVLPIVTGAASLMIKGMQRQLLGI
tara:strand:+ start:30 stop:503 length:474 start_codon:yes stop_codon:yes gene_type:complete